MNASIFICCCCALCTIINGLKWHNNSDAMEYMMELYHVLESASIVETAGSANTVHSYTGKG